MGDLWSPKIEISGSMSSTCFQVGIGWGSVDRPCQWTPPNRAREVHVAQNESTYLDMVRDLRADHIGQHPLWIAGIRGIPDTMNLRYTIEFRCFQYSFKRFQLIFVICSTLLRGNLGKRDFRRPGRSRKKSRQHGHTLKTLERRFELNHAMSFRHFVISSFHLWCTDL